MRSMTNPCSHKFLLPLFSFGIPVWRASKNVLGPRSSQGGPPKQLSSNPVHMAVAFLGDPANGGCPLGCAFTTPPKPKKNGYPKKDRPTRRKPTKKNKSSDKLPAAVATSFLCAPCKSAGRGRCAPASAAAGRAPGASRTLGASRRARSAAWWTSAAARWPAGTRRRSNTSKTTKDPLKESVSILGDPQKWWCWSLKSCGFHFKHT